MKKTILALGLTAISGAALGADALVVDVDPNYRSVVRYENVPTTQIVCNDMRSNNGMIERGTAGIFGSTEGAIGTAVGVAIGDKIGNGSGRDAAKVLGGIIGNRIGNNVARNNYQSCHEVERYVRQQYTEQVVDSYRVQVELDGNTYVVNRRFEPQIGSFIPVQVSVR
jgi:uncharacterized protein YcfJ